VCRKRVLGTTTDRPAAKTSDTNAKLEGMHAMEDISRAFEWIAVAVLIVAFSLAVLVVARDLVRGADATITYQRGREIFGRGLLIGLEVLVAADLIRTVAVEPTFTNVGVLGLIVIVRTLLVFSLDVEIDGVVPWRKRELGVNDAEH
jgi:uncharacterized membrane protein